MQSNKETVCQSIKPSHMSLWTSNLNDQTANVDQPRLVVVAAHWLGCATRVSESGEGRAALADVVQDVNGKGSQALRCGVIIVLGRALGGVAAGHRTSVALVGVTSDGAGNSEGHKGSNSDEASEHCDSR